MATEMSRFEMSDPTDVRDLGRCLRDLDPSSITRLAIVAKVEGPATINDYSRGLARVSLDAALKANGLPADVHTQIILSTGCEGVTTPGGTLIVERRIDASRFPGLAFGIARSPPLAARDMVGLGHVAAAARVTRDAMADAGLGVQEVELVLMKSPVLPRANAENVPEAHRSRIASTSFSRGVAALGIAAALGDVDMALIEDRNLEGPQALHGSRGMVFSGTETDCVEAIVLGNRSGHPKTIRCGTISDLLDIEGMASIITEGGHDSLARAMSMARDGRIGAAFLKAGLAFDGRLRGHRTTIMSSEVDPDKQMRAAASGVLGALLGDTRFFVSGGTENQAAEGRGIFAVVMAGVDDPAKE